MDHAAELALGRVWTLVASVLSALTALPGLTRGAMVGPVWARAFGTLRRAEAAARRAIALLAAERPASPDIPPGIAPPPATGPATPSRETPDTERTPSPRPFALSDPFLDPLALAGLADSIDRAAFAPPSGTPRSIMGLKARMAALRAVMDNPGAAVARYVALRDRPRRHIFAPNQCPRLRPGLPPGYLRRLWQDWDMDVLMEIHQAVLARQGAPPACPPFQS